MSQEQIGPPTRQGATAILKAGRVEEWNSLRNKNPAWKPVVSSVGEPARLGGADLSGADLSGADLRGADLSGADLRSADLGEADLRGADLNKAILSDTILVWANLSGTDLSEANLRGANLSGASLGGANLGEADLSGADLRGTDLRDANLKEASLGESELSDASLVRANLRGASLSDAILIGANLRGADLSDASLTGANLGEAILSEPERRGSSLRWADYVERRFGAPRSHRASPDGARIDEGALAGHDLRGCRLRLDGHNIRGCVFDANQKEPFCILKRTYTGPRLLLLILLFVVFLLPYGAKAGFWLLVYHAGEVLDKSGVSLPVRTNRYEIWQLLLGVDVHWGLVILVVLLIAYQGVRFWVTLRVSELREHERESGYAPRWKITRLYWGIHRWFLRPVLWVALIVTAWNAWQVLKTPVEIPQLPVRSQTVSEGTRAEMGNGR